MAGILRRKLQHLIKGVIILLVSLVWLKVSLPF